MKRYYLKSLSIIPLLVAEKNTIAGKQHHHRHKQSAIAGSRGLHLFNADNIWSQIRPGDKLTLIRENRDNDPYAISVNWRGYRLGYIPDHSKRSLAFLMDKGHVLTARVTRLQQGDDPWEKIGIRIDRQEKNPEQLPIGAFGSDQLLAA